MTDYEYYSLLNGNIGWIREPYFAGETVANDGATVNKIVDNAAHDTKLRYVCRHTEVPKIPKRTPTLQKEIFVDYSMGMETNQHSTFEKITFEIEGGMESGIFLYYTFGASSNAVGGTPKIHTITPSPNRRRPSFCYIHQVNNTRASTSVNNKIIGCQVDKLTLSGKTGEAVKMSISCIGKQNIVSTTDLLHADNRASIDDLGQVFTLGMARITVSAGDFAVLDDYDTTNMTHAFSIESFDFTYSNNLQDEQWAVTNALDEYYATQRYVEKPTVTLKLTLRMADPLLIQKWNVIKNSGDIGVQTTLTLIMSRNATDNTDDIQLIFQRIRIEDFEYEGDDVLKCNVTFFGTDDAKASTNARYGCYAVVHDNITSLGNTGKWYPYNVLS